MKMPFKSEEKYKKINEWLFGNATAENYLDTINSKNFNALPNDTNAIVKKENKFSFGDQSDIDFGDLNAEEVKTYVLEIRADVNASFSDAEEGSNDEKA